MKLAYTLLGTLGALSIAGGALGASTNDITNVLLGMLPGFLGVIALMFIYKE